MHAVPFRIALLITSLVAPALDLPAQEPTATEQTVRAAPGKWLVGASLGVPGVGPEPSPALFTIGGNWTQLNVGRVGTDFSASVVPYGFIHAFMAVAARGGVALPLAVSSRMLLLPSGGMSVIGALGRPGGFGAIGYNAGMAAVFFPGKGAGVRTGITWHRFSDERTALWLLEVGFVRNPLR